MNGQPIMQLTPSSIPATIQLTPQTAIATHQPFQTVNTMQPQLVQQQTTLPTLSTLPPPPPQQQQQQQQQQHQHQQQQKPKTSPQKIKITSQQIIKSAIPNKSPEIVTEEKKPKSKNYAEQILQQVQQQKQQTHTTFNAMPATPAGLTVQRISKQATKTYKSQVASEDQSNSVSAPKIPLLNVNNVTISRVSTQQQQQQQRKQPDNNVKQQTTETTTTKLPAIKKVLNKMCATKRTATAETKLATKDITTTTTTTSNETKLLTQNKTVTEVEKANNSTIKLETMENTTRPTIPSKPAVIKCDQCGRNFKKKEHLTQHVKLHAGIRPFKCTQTGCEKTFSRKEHLLRHLISHTGKKMFSCDLCNKPFSRKDNLNKHRRIHSMQVQEESYKCEICDKTFIPKAYYEHHMQTHHKVQKEKPNKPANELCKEMTPVKSQSETHHQQQLMQQRQPQAQQKIMHLQLPSNQTGGTITITQTSNQNNNNQSNINHHDATVLNLPVSLGNYVQLTPTQFVNTATGQIMNKI